MTSRPADLLRAAAEALADYTDPFTGDWLADHQVTFDECMMLSEHLAAGATLIAWALDNPTLVNGAMDGIRLAAMTQALTRAVDRWTGASADRHSAAPETDAGNTTPGTVTP
jgi:hypothetical protein